MHTGEKGTIYIKGLYVPIIYSVQMYSNYITKKSYYRKEANEF